MKRQSPGPPAPRLPDPWVRSGEIDGLVRQCHIFTSALRDVLEARLIATAAPAPLSESQFHLLKLIALDGNHQVRDAAQFLGVSGPAATKNVAKLERHRRVRRDLADPATAPVRAGDPEGARGDER